MPLTCLQGGLWSHWHLKSLLQCILGWWGLNAKDISSQCIPLVSSAQQGYKEGASDTPKVAGMGCHLSTGPCNKLSKN